MGITVMAAVVNAPGSAPIMEEVILTSPSTDEVLIRVVATGVCHTDIAWAAGEFGQGEDSFPVVLGHETSGIVEAVGRRDSPFSVGDRVVAALTHHCGVCSYCERGDVILCDHREDRILRMSRSNGAPLRQAYGVGGFAEMAIVRASSLVRIPADVPMTSAAVVGCAVACGIGAVWNIARLQPGSTVAVFGAGAVGTSVVMGAALAGAARIVVVDPIAERRDAALHFGANETLDFTDDLLQTLIASGGVDYAFESAGKPVAMQAAVRVTRRGGTVVLMGAAAADATFSLNALEFVASQRKLLACLGGGVRPHDDFVRYFSLYQSGTLDLDALVTTTTPLSGLTEAFARNQAGIGLRTVVVTE